MVARTGRGRRRSWSAVALVASVVLAAGCGDDGAGAPAATEATAAPAAAGGAVTLPGTSWALASVGGDGDGVPVIGVPTLEFGADGTTLTGSTGCNRFAGSYEVSGSDLTVTLGPVTLAGCAGQAAADQEAAILDRLPQVATFTGELVLLDADGTTLLIYEAGLSTLAGTSWTATGINNGRGGLESTAATETVTADFGADGALSGFAGCNNYTATYALSGDDAISITAVATTRKACADEATALESEYVAALGAATTYAISGDSLTLRDDSGAMQATYVLAG